MKKIDPVALRTQLEASYAEVVWQMRANPDPKIRQEASEIERAIPMLIELSLLGTLEVERAANAMDGIKQLGHLVGNAMMTVCAMLEDVDPLKPGEMPAEHQAIHVFTDTLDRTMHSIYNEAKDGSNPNLIKTVPVDLPMRDVGDA